MALRVPAPRTNSAPFISPIANVCVVHGTGERRGLSVPAWHQQGESQVSLTACLSRLLGYFRLLSLGINSPARIKESAGELLPAWCARLEGSISFKKWLCTESERDPCPIGLWMAFVLLHFLKVMTGFPWVTGFQMVILDQPAPWERRPRLTHFHPGIWNLRSCW